MLNNWTCWTMTCWPSSYEVVLLEIFTYLVCQLLQNPHDVAHHNAITLSINDESQYLHTFFPQVKVTFYSLQCHMVNMVNLVNMVNMLNSLQCNMVNMVNMFYSLQCDMVNMHSQKASDSFFHSSLHQGWSGQQLKIWVNWGNLKMILIWKYLINIGSDKWSILLSSFCLLAIFM